MTVINFSLVLLSLFSFFSLSVRAQYGPSSGSSPSLSASPSSETDSGSACTPGNIHQVTVGQNGNKFDPSTIFAHPGDIVVFTFFPSNHSVIRTDYTGAKSNTEYSGNPCVPIEVLQPGTKGFFSGNKLVESIPSPGNVSARTVRR
jgi:plastocyanin